MPGLCYNSLMPLFSKKSSGPVSTDLIFDVESDSVCVAIVQYESGKVPRVVYHAENEVEHKAHTDGAYLTRNMLKKLELSAADVQKALTGLTEKKAIRHPRVDRVHVVLSSPWIISKLSCVERRFERETMLRQKDAIDLLEKEREAAAKMFIVGDSAAIDAKLFEVKINGYPVSEYVGKRAKALEGTMVVSFSSKKLLSVIKSNINAYVRSGDEVFHSALILRYLALRSAMPHQADYIWLQVHGELTDVLVVRQGDCAVSGSLPFGYDTLVRNFARQTGESESTAMSALAFIDSNANTSDSIEKTRTVLGEILAEWTSDIAGLISGGREGSLPGVVYVSSARFSSAFETSLRQFSPSALVQPATTVSMAPFVEFAPSVSADLSASLYAAALPLSQKL